MRIDGAAGEASNNGEDFVVAIVFHFGGKVSWKSRFYSMVTVNRSVFKALRELFCWPRNYY